MRRKECNIRISVYIHVLMTCLFIPTVKSFGLFKKSLPFQSTMLTNVCVNDQLSNYKYPSYLTLQMAYGYQDNRSKRQERVGHLVRSEIASIVNQGAPLPKTNSESMYIDDELRKRISIVDANVSPDLRQARITVSIIADPASKSTGGNNMMDQRRAYSWLVSNTFQIRHALAQRLSHLKILPNLTFVEVDVGNAVDVMQLIDKVSQKGYNYKREHFDLNLEEYFDEDDDDEFDFEFDDDDDDNDNDNDNDGFDFEFDDNDDDDEDNKPINNIEDL